MGGEKWDGHGDPRSEVGGSCMDRTLSAAFVGGAAGTFFGSCRAAWNPDPVTTADKKFVGAALARTDTRSILRMIARPAVGCAMVALSFAASECAAESIRNKKDALNSGIGGAVAGLVIGSMSRRADIMVATAMGMSVLLFSVEYSTPRSAFDESHLWHKTQDLLPEKHEESDSLKSLKEKYPHFKEN